MKSSMMNTKPISNFKTNELITALRRRCTWTEFKESLKKAELPVGLGWSELEANATENSDLGKKMRDHIQTFYIAHLLAGERYVQLYDISHKLGKAITAKLEHFVISPVIFSSNYPLPIDQTKLIAAPSEPTLVAVAAISNGDKALVFCSARNFAERNTYPFSQIAPQVAQVYGGIDELITIKKIYFQAFDLVIIRASLDRVEVCLDMPNLGYIDFSETALKLLAAATTHLSDLDEVYRSQPLNVFNTIKDIFESPKEGRVKTLSFRTLTGSRKFEKMVRASEDLRNEKFHHAGMTAVKHEISPYELTVDWEFSLPKGFAEIELKASIKELSYENPILPGFYVRAIEQLSLLAAINKIVKYL